MRFAITRSRRSYSSELTRPLLQLAATLADPDEITLRDIPPHHDDGVLADSVLRAVAKIVDAVDSREAVQVVDVILDLRGRRVDAEVAVCIDDDERRIPPERMREVGPDAGCLEGVEVERLGILYRSIAHAIVHRCQNGAEDQLFG